MLRYRYSVRDPHGQEMKGEVAAPDREEAVRLLQESGVYVTSVEATSKPVRLFTLRRAYAPDDQKIFLLESWSMFLEIGNSVQSALLKVRKIVRDRAISRALQSVQSRVDQGMRLSEAVALSRLFPLSWVAVLSAGETVGDFVGPLRAMRRQVLLLRRLRGEAIRLLLMPAVLVGLSLVWFWIFLRSVVPAMLDFGLTVGIPNPIVVVLFQLSHGLLLATQILAAVLGLGVLVALRVNRSNQVMGSFQSWIPVRTPVVGPIISCLHLLVVSSELRLQLEAGIPLETAIHTLSLSIPSRPIRRELFEVSLKLQQGVPADEAICSLSFIPIDQKALIVAGGASGQLPKALGILGRFAQEALRFRLKILVGLLQHAVLFACGLLVGLLFAAYFGLWLSTLSTTLSVSVLAPSAQF
ncbi:MAG: type II secretion system F family protein [Candidatus Omnitrophica bacterium]|nr:type II secretion system F family protein [Candidatus Omnitrophota bacterium]